MTQAPLRESEGPWGWCGARGLSWYIAEHSTWRRRHASSCSDFEINFLTVMVNLTTVARARKPTIIYGFKRGKVPAKLRPNILPKPQVPGGILKLHKVKRWRSFWAVWKFFHSTSDNNFHHLIFLCFRGKLYEWDVQAYGMLEKQRIYRHPLPRRNQFISRLCF